MQSNKNLVIALIVLVGYCSFSIIIGVTRSSDKNTPTLSAEVYQKVLKLSEKKMAYLDSLLLINEELFKEGRRNESDYRERKGYYDEIKDQECKLMEYISDIYYHRDTQSR